MRVLWIGFGQAGGKLANTMMEVNRNLYSAIAINTEQADLVGLNYIREKVLIGRYALKGRGVGADIELAANVAETTPNLRQLSSMPRYFCVRRTR